MPSAPDPADDTAVRSIPHRLVEGWNAADGSAFAAPFSETADFIAFEGTHLEGRAQIADFHQQIFDTIVKGTRIDDEVRFVRFLRPDVAVIHAYASVWLQGRTEPSPSRDSMQLFVAEKRDGEWRVQASLNARRLTLERQAFLDDLDSLPAEDRDQVADFVRYLKWRRGAERMAQATANGERG